jgi:putative ABC transport system permease protein
MANQNRGIRHEVRLLFSAMGLAASSIAAHKLRSSLTLLGTIIGVASVIMVGAAINGMGAYAEQSTASAFGAESFGVAQVALSGNLSRRAVQEKMKHNKAIHTADARFAEEVAGNKVYFSPNRSHGGSSFRRDNLMCDDATVNGVAASMVDIRDLKVVDGRFFSEEEERSSAHVAAIGDEVREVLFGDSGSPVGKTLRIDGSEFLVVGVMEKLGSSFGQSQDRNAYIPVSVFNRAYGEGTGFTLLGRAKPASGLSLIQALDETRIALRARFHVKPGDPDNFDIQTPDSMRGFIDQILGVITAAVVPLTLISLVVGGIVIMNIMLVSVIERTSEIGVRKALGARHRDIMAQVLIEAVTLSFLGGAIGVSIGALVTFVLAQALAVPLSISAGYVLLAMGVSTTVGVLSGWYPALRAAKMQPVEALRAD